MHTGILRVSVQERCTHMWAQHKWEGHCVLGTQRDLGAQNASHQSSGHPRAPAVSVQKSGHGQARAKRGHTRGCW